MLVCIFKSVIQCSIFQTFYLTESFLQKNMKWCFNMHLLNRNLTLIRIFPHLCSHINLTRHFPFQIFSVGSSVCFGKTIDFDSFGTHCWLWPCKSREPETGFQCWKLQCVGCKVRSVERFSHFLQPYSIIRLWYELSKK